MNSPEFDKKPASVFTYEVVTENDSLDEISQQFPPYREWGDSIRKGGYPSDFLRRYVSSDERILVLSRGDGNVVTGVAWARIDPQPEGDKMYISEIDTHPSFMEQGVATGMLNELKKVAQSKGVVEVWLITESNNIAARRLYKKHGFQEEQHDDGASNEESGFQKHGGAPFIYSIIYSYDMNNYEGEEV